MLLQHIPQAIFVRTNAAQPPNRGEQPVIFGRLSLPLGRPHGLQLPAYVTPRTCRFRRRYAAGKHNFDPLAWGLCAVLFPDRFNRFRSVQRIQSVHQIFANVLRQTPAEVRVR